MEEEEEGNNNGGDHYEDARDNSSSSSEPGPAPAVVSTVQEPAASSSTNNSVDANPTPQGIQERPLRSAQDIVNAVLDSLWPHMANALVNQPPVQPPPPVAQLRNNHYNHIRNIFARAAEQDDGNNEEDNNIADDEDDDGMDNVQDGYLSSEEEEVGNRPQPVIEILDPDDPNPYRNFRFRGYLTVERQPDSDDARGDEDDAAMSPREAFDQQLPARHSYLGEGMEELQGRILFDDGSQTPEIPLIVMGIQLVPGQTLPLTIFHTVFQNAIRRCVMSHRVFGVIHNNSDSLSSSGGIFRGALGTIAEIYEYQEENEPPNANLGLTTFALKAKGRQRFNVLSFRRQADGNLMGTVQIRPEIRLPPIVQSILFEQTHRYRFPMKRRIQETDDEGNNDEPMPSSSSSMTPKLAKTTSVANSSADSDATIDTELAKMQEQILERRKATKFYSAFTPFPYFVYEQYDEHVLVAKIHKKLKVDLKGLTESGSVIPKDATELSFWLAQNVTTDDHHRIKLLKMDSAVERLRYELDLLSKASKVIICQNCHCTIAESGDIFSMNVEGPQGTYVNVHGYIHETLTVHKTKSIVLKGPSSTEQCWFPGYAWTIAECRRCLSHIGWKYKAVGRLQPQKFWGLARRSISFKYNFMTDEEAEEQNSNAII